MSPLTKAFVVLVTVLSILLVTLVVPFVAQVDQLRAEVTDAQAISAASEQTIRELRAERTAALEAQQAKEQSLNNTINQLQTQVAQLEGDKTALTAQLAKAESDAQATQAAMIALAESDKAKASLLENYVGQLEDSNGKLVESQTENVQLVDRNNQLQSNLSALERQVRKLREDLVASNQRVNRLEQDVVAGGGSAIGGGGNAVAVAALPSEPIYGQITETSQTAAGLTLVTLNVGSTDGIARNQSFVVYRDAAGSNEYIATVEIQSVDASQSVASVKSELQPIREGDFVVSAPSLSVR